METEGRRLPLRRRECHVDAAGYTSWSVVTEWSAVPPSQCALVLCDVWDQHWCRGAQERLEALLPRLAEVVSGCRAAGMAIIHSPSGTMDHYRGHPARLRAASVAARRALPIVADGGPPLPIDHSDEGCDTGESYPEEVWTRQHPAIAVEDGDYVSDDGDEVLAIVDHHGIRRLLYAGVHTNMCVLNRPFGIKRMVAGGVPTALVRDLTDTMYNPSRPPYVSHEEGTDLVVRYIEAFWCPTVASDDLMRVIEGTA